MLDALFRLSAEFGPVASWFLIFIAAVVAVFVAYVGIALLAVLRATDQEQQQVRYRVFSDLLGLFRRGRQR